MPMYHHCKFIELKIYAKKFEFEHLRWNGPCSTRCIRINRKDSAEYTELYCASIHTCAF